MKLELSRCILDKVKILIRLKYLFWIPLNDSVCNKCIMLHTALGWQRQLCTRVANHKKFWGPPKVGHDCPDDLPHPAQLGRGHLAAGIPLAHVAQLGRSPNFGWSSKLEPHQLALSWNFKLPKRNESDCGTKMSTIMTYLAVAKG